MFVIRLLKQYAGGKQISLEMRKCLNMSGFELATLVGVSSARHWGEGILVLLLLTSFLIDYRLRWTLHLSMRVTTLEFAKNRVNVINHMTESDRDRVSTHFLVKEVCQAF